MTDATADAVFFNPLEPGYVPDPFPHLAELRRLEPVHQTVIGLWVLFRYDDVSRLLRDPGMSVQEENNINRHDERIEMFERAAGPEGRDFTPSMLDLDPPDHTRLRRLVSKAFTPASIDALRPRVQVLVDDALDVMAADMAGPAGVTDVVGRLAFPLPFDVISEMLGMPESDKDQIAEWSGALVKTLDPIISEDEVRAAVAAGKQMDDLIDDVIEWKRANPAGDLLTALIAAEEDGDRLTSEELRAQVSLLFVAGHETTVNLIGTGILELLRRPDQLALLRDDPSLDAPAVDELLRFVSPVQFSRRITLEDARFGDRTIPRGTFVLAGLAAANHDPEKWGPTADELDLRRTGTAQHLAFGSGSHYCLGSSLAKLEAQLAIGRFIRRFPDARVAGEPEWNGRINLRGLERLDVAVG